MLANGFSYLSYASQWFVTVPIYRSGTSRGWDFSVLANGFSYLCYASQWFVTVPIYGSGTSRGRDSFYASQWFFLPMLC